MPRSECSAVLLKHWHLQTYCLLLEDDLVATSCVEPAMSVVDLDEGRDQAAIVRVLIVLVAFVRVAYYQVVHDRVAYAREARYHQAGRARGLR